MITIENVVNPQVTMLLDSIAGKMAELKHPPLDKLSPEQSRTFYKIARTYFQPLHVDGVKITNSVIPSSHGHNIPIRIYTPSNVGPFSVLVYFHGGGWVFGDLDSCDNVCRYISLHANVIVISVGYRLAPEHKYPAAFLDAVEAVKWTYQHVESLNGDVSKIGIGGESSGGNLAAATAMYFRDEENIELSYQFLITPVLNYCFDTPSYQANYVYNLTTEKMKWFWGHYLQKPQDGLEIYASPLRSQNFDLLPKTLLVTAEFDPLRDEGSLYAECLTKAGVRVEHLHYNDLVHSFINMIGNGDRAKQALVEISSKLYNLHQP
ncbi:alpha/beta hydrolase [Fictibacillus nanhaiensis]|uniref:alpha/beta hydrolase n=1 Tax=Fictibacillus nanhaiensis TaxID=742169 RepID=UPI002E1A6A0B|nr:alpha/beta hydrolase [Fictibacillus nanhaiensis]